jgi:hypothetical protein
MAKEVVISSSRLNRYGSRVLTEGIEIGHYARNPILLWMHNRAFCGNTNEVLPIGKIENLRKDGDKLVGTPVFDVEDAFAKKIADKWEAGFLNMVSAGLGIIETSTDALVMQTGQTRPTITKSRLDEVSIVDIGANDDAVALYYEGKLLKLADGEDCEVLPKITINHTLNSKKMEQKVISLKLGLPESSGETEILAAIGVLLAARDERDSLHTESDNLRLSAIEGEVDSAIKLGKFASGKRSHFVELGKSSGIEVLRSTLECMTPSVRPTQIINQNGGTGTTFATPDDWKKLSDVPAAQRIELRTNDPTKYKELYEAEYGTTF